MYEYNNNNDLSLSPSIKYRIHNLKYCSLLEIDYIINAPRTFRSISSATNGTIYRSSSDDHRTVIVFLYKILIIFNNCLLQLWLNLECLIFRIANPCMRLAFTTLVDIRTTLVGINSILFVDKVFQG